MTRFETTSGVALGARFAGSAGAMIHMTEQEALDLFSLDLRDEVISDNHWSGTVQDLIDLVRQTPVISAAEMLIRWNLNMNQTLHY